MKICSCCKKEFPLEHFGLVKGRRGDGRNCYCVMCCREKVYAGRARRKEIVKVQQEAQQNLQFELSQVEPEIEIVVDKVAPLASIACWGRRQARTQMRGWRAA